MRLGDYRDPGSPERVLESAITRYRKSYFAYADKFFREELDEIVTDNLSFSRESVLSAAIDCALADPIITRLRKDKISEANTAIRATLLRRGEDTLAEAVLRPSWNVLTTIFIDMGIVSSKEPFFAYDMRWQQVHNGDRLEYFDQLSRDSGSSSTTTDELLANYIKDIGNGAFSYVDRSAAEVFALGDKPF